MTYNFGHWKYKVSIQHPLIFLESLFRCTKWILSTYNSSYNSEVCTYSCLNTYIRLIWARLPIGKIDDDGNEMNKCKVMKNTSDPPTAQKHCSVCLKKNNKIGIKCTSCKQNVHKKCWRLKHSEILDLANCNPNFECMSSLTG